jgi:hypothetical protein
VLQQNELDDDEAISETERAAYTRSSRTVSSISFNTRNSNLGGGNTDTDRQTNRGGDISFDDLLNS